MVAKRKKRRKVASEEEAARAALAAVPVTDEDPGLFWGPDWREMVREAKLSWRQDREWCTNTTAPLDSKGAAGIGKGRARLAPPRA